jgi:uncharacterized protein involved in exopolysaccharide biosynthesis
MQYKILQFIAPLYEQAKVEERRDTPSVIVLDKGRPAERKSKPKISLYALIALVSSSLIALIVVLSQEMFQRLKAEDAERMNLVLNAVRSDWFGLRFWRRRD